MWTLIKNDWDKLPQNVRYLFEIGIVLVFNAWVLDHWLPDYKLPYEFLGYFDIRIWCYNVGQLFILVSIVFIVIKQLLNLPQLINNYKVKYPIRDIGTKFDLIWFSGKLILFDHKNMTYYHVYPWETAQDLNFVSYGIHVEDHFPNPKTLKIEITKGKILDITKYQNGGSINTAIDVVRTEKS